MKIKMLIPIALVLCLVFSLCACGTTANTDPETTPATTEATTTAPAETAATTVAATEAETDAKTDAQTETQDTTAEDVFTGEDAFALVETTYPLESDNLYYVFRGIYMIDGYNHYAIDLRKTLEDHTTYISTYFVTLDGSDILEGYITDGVAYVGEDRPSVEVTEENAVKIVNAAFDFDENCFLTYRGTEEIDGTTYYVVDLRKSLETNTTYLASYFVKADGTQIVDGYYEGETPVLAE